MSFPTGRRRRRRNERKQKRGCRAGVYAHLRRRPHQLPLPSIFLSNARSITNKMDELKLQMAANGLVQDCCILLIMETWLNSSAIELAGRTAHHQDRNSNSGKSRGGGLCIYVNNNATTIDSHCSPDLEYLTVKCRPTGVYCCHGDCCVYTTRCKCQLTCTMPSALNKTPIQRQYT